MIIMKLMIDKRRFSDVVLINLVWKIREFPRTPSLPEGGPAPALPGSRPRHQRRSSHTLGGAAPESRGRLDSACETQRGRGTSASSSFGETGRPRIALGLPLRAGLRLRPFGRVGRVIRQSERAGPSNLHLRIAPNFPSRTRPDPRRRP